MPKEVWIHIGTHKTGTTSIQFSMSALRDELSKRGLAYPYAGCPRVKSVSFGHHLLPWALNKHSTDQDFWPPDEDLMKVWGDLNSEIQNSEVKKSHP